MNVEDTLSSSTSATKYRTTASVSPDVSPASPAGVAPQPSAQLQLPKPQPQQQSKVVNPSKAPAPQPSVPAGASLRSPRLQPQPQQKPKVVTPSGSPSLQPSATRSDAVPAQSSLSLRPQSLPSGPPASQPSAPPNVTQSPQSSQSSRPQRLPSGSRQSSPSPRPKPRPEQQLNVVIPSGSPAPQRLPSESPAPRSSEPPQSRLSSRPKPLPSESSEPPQSRLSSRLKPLPSGSPSQPQPQQQTRIMIPSCEPNALCSGGGISFLTRNKNARFSYGYASFKGKRSSMEDFYEARISEVDGQMVAFFGVFDGHGGSRAAEYLKNNLFKNLSNHPDFTKDTKSAIVQSFRNTDDNYINEEKGQQKDAGSTASTAVLLGDRLFVANVGDSRVVACRAGSAIPLSTDHKPDRSDERQRIEEAGGYVIWAGTWRVGGVLAVSRAFGDKLLKPFVVAEPEIQEEEIDGVDFIIIASDGLWNVLSNKDAVAIINDIADAEAASRKLVEESYAKGSSDNITCVVIRFENAH